MQRTGHGVSREIERKFLIEKLPPDVRRSRRLRIAQGYLATTAGGLQVRLRRDDRAFWLTCKAGAGRVRQEREIGLSAAQFAVLWPGTAGRRLYKIRYQVGWNGSVIEIDVYTRRNRGLIVAEVEFPTLSACRRFKPPAWFGREITGERRYSNIWLAKD